MGNNRLCSAFSGHERIASGTLSFVVEQLVETLGDDAILATILDNQTSEIIEVDFRGSLSEVLSRIKAQESGDIDPAKVEAASPRKRGRPKLGVTAREITLLPRHWQWLDEQPGGASVNIRKLVENARKQSEHQSKQRAAQNAVYKFLTTLASDLNEYEEVLRALYKNDPVTFEALIEQWPKHIRAHTRKLALPAFSAK